MWCLAAFKICQKAQFSKFQKNATHTKISIILMKKNFQRYAIAHSVAFYVYIVEVGSLLLWKFGLGSYSSFCGLLALCAAIDGWSDFDSCISRTFIGHARGCPMLPGYPNLIYMGLNHVSEDVQSLNLPTGDFCMTCIIKVANLATWS